MPTQSKLLRRQSILILIFLILVIVFMTTYRMGVVRGTSMLPTYQDGQVVLVRRKNWFSPPLHRNDVVLLQKDREVIMKRVFRIPGDEIDAGNPNLLEITRMRGLSDYYEQLIQVPYREGLPRLFVPDGYIVVLGDNPSVSEDSRLFGPVPERDVLGTVVNAPVPPEALGRGAQLPANFQNEQFHPERGARAASP